MKFTEYESKYDNYNIAQRLEDLKDVLDVQCQTGNYDENEYLRGLANGLMLAYYIMAEPYGKEVPFFESKKMIAEIKKEMK